MTSFVWIDEFLPYIARRVTIAFGYNSAWRENETRLFETRAPSSNIRSASNVQTTVIRETRIPNASRVTRILRDSGAIYVVTVRDAKGEQVIYVNEAGLILQAPVSAATVQKSAGTALPAFESSQMVVTYDQVQQNASRYQLLERKGTKEMYRDSRTGQKMTVRLENN